MNLHLLFSPKNARTFTIAFLVFLSFLVNAQQPYGNRLSFLVKERSGIAPAAEEQFLVVVSDAAAFQKLLDQKTISYSPGPGYDYNRVFSLKITWEKLVKDILPLKEVRFIDIKRTPKEEREVSGFDLSTNKVARVHALYPQYNGKSLNVSVKEQLPDTTDIDFKGRFFSTPLQAMTNSTHATLMTTIIAGAGNSSANGKGVAWGSYITSSSFNSLLPDPDAYYTSNGITVQNHSYGTGIENYYGADAFAYDASAFNQPTLLHVFSAGNAGLMTDSIGRYKNVEGFANITGSFKMAKNILTIGATDQYQQPIPISSKGPAYDGRVKPELMAAGFDGSSGAAAVVSGIALILQQAYKDLHDSIAHAALIKAVLINSADDIGPPEVDFFTGYGAANAWKALETILQNQILHDIVRKNEPKTFNLTVPVSLKKLRITLTWNDVPAEPNATKALVNDLDLELVNTTTGEHYLPWVLIHFPHIDSLVLLPERKKDTLNTVEQITIDHPAPGDYQLIVKSGNMVSDEQSFFIAYQFDSLDAFTWQMPLNSPLLAGEKTTLRWRTTMDQEMGQLEYRLDNGDWVQLKNDLSLNHEFYEWDLPDTFSQAQLRMTINGTSFETGSFTIAPPLNLSVGFNCPDSVLLFWPAIDGASGYQLYDLGEKYMEPLSFIVDTVMILAKSAIQNPYFAVAPVRQQAEGRRSAAIDYKLQGVECYVKTFFASLTNNNVELTLQLGSLYNIQQVQWEKLGSDGFKTIYTEPTINDYNLQLADQNISAGQHHYRVKLTLMDDRIIYSNEAVIYFAQTNQFRLYPNPAKQGEPIKLIAYDSDVATMYIYNVSGQLLLTQRLDDVINIIPAHLLSKGIYLLRIVDDNGTQTMLKLSVL